MVFKQQIQPIHS